MRAVSLLAAPAAALLLAASASAQFTYDQTVEQFETLWYPNVLDLQFGGTPNLPSGDATLFVTAFGDFSAQSEYFDLSLDGGAYTVSRVFESAPNGQSKSDYGSQLSISYIIPQATIASMASNGSIDARVTPSTGMNDLNNGEFVRLRLVYDYIPAPGSAALLALGGLAAARRRR